MKVALQVRIPANRRSSRIGSGGNPGIDYVRSFNGRTCEFVHHGSLYRHQAFSRKGLSEKADRKNEQRRKKSREYKHGWKSCAIIGGTLARDRPQSSPNPIF